MRYLNRLSLWLPLLLYIGLIFFLSSRTLPSAAGMMPDYLMHGIEYLFLGAFMVRALNDGLRHPAAPRILIGALVLCILLAILDEITQRSVPTRIASISDVVADSVGAFAGIALVRGGQRLLLRSRRQPAGGPEPGGA